VGVKSGKASNGYGRFHRLSTSSPNLVSLDFPLDDYNVCNSMIPSLLKREGMKTSCIFTTMIYQNDDVT
jgi:hypothetical protein